MSKDEVLECLEIAIEKVRYGLDSQNPLTALDCFRDADDEIKSCNDFELMMRLAIEGLVSVEFEKNYSNREAIFDTLQKLERIRMEYWGLWHNSTI
jgi:hypothetical protein